MIDFVIVCDKILPFINKFTIDEEKKYALSNYSSKGKITYSDHNSLISEMYIQYDRMKPERREIFDYKNQEGMKKFKVLTAVKGKFSNLFNNELNFTKQMKLWRKKLNFTIKMCFKKVRLRKNNKIKCKLFSKRKNAISTRNFKIKHQAETELQREEAEHNLNIIKSNIDQLNDKSKGKQNNIWQLKKNFFPKNKSVVPMPNCKTKFVK